MFYEICDVYNIEYNIQQIYNNKHEVDDIVKINSKLFITWLSYSIDMRRMDCCEKGKMFYTRYIYQNDIRLRTRMSYMTK